MQYTAPLRQLLLLLILFSVYNLSAQKRPLDHSVYDGWKSLSHISVSEDGGIITALISPQQGDTMLWIHNLKKNKTLTVERIRRYTAPDDGKYCIGLQKASYENIRKARIKKKKAEDFPKDSLLLIDNETFEIEKIPDVKSFKTAQKNSGHIAYSVETPKDTAKKESFKPKDLIILHNTFTQHKDTIRNAKEYIFNKYGNSFAVSIEPDKKDSTDVRRVIFFNLETGLQKIISLEKAEYKSLSFDEKGEQLVYLTTKDTSKLEQKSFDVRYFKSGADSAVILAGKNPEGMPDGWIFSEHASPRFSKNGKRIIISPAPKQAPKDTTIVDFEMAKLDIWNWQDPVIQPQQLVDLKKELNRTFKGIISPGEPEKFTPIANQEMPYCAIADENNGRFALLWSDLPYLRENQWDISPINDVWVRDIQTNELHLIAEELEARPILSPGGNFTVWWNASERQWFSHDNASGTTKNLTQNIPANFWNEKNDVPFEPGSYGIAAWGKNDEYLLLNDAFDIWKVDPKALKKPENITFGEGRKDSITFRYIHTDPENKFIEAEDIMILSAFNNASKEKGYYTLKLAENQSPQKRIMEKYNFTGLNKAENNNLILFQKSNFNTSPDLYVTKDFWQTTGKLTDINPQMQDYNWGTAELFSWTSFAGVPLQGIVYKPGSFNPNRKYPVLIYFYEKHSDNLYSYFPPAPSRSTVNIPFFVSNDYIVFTPDIDYTVGNPGNDAYNAVVSGAEALAENPWVDRENMAIQGQSWGGYQVAYLVTRTDMFKAAGAGAPVSNMTSAYGGIRWESGRSRQFQYEQTQSRIGAAMSDSLQLYIKNSPVFFADKVNTPLLIMHNDKDGAVPWYQGIEYFMSLRRLNKPVWMLQYNNEQHNLRYRRNAKDLSIRLQQFFDHFLKGLPAPEWMTKGVPATEKGKNWGY